MSIFLELFTKHSHESMGSFYGFVVKYTPSNTAFPVFWQCFIILTARCHRDKRYDKLHFQ